MVFGYQGFERGRFKASMVYVYSWGEGGQGRFRCFLWSFLRIEGSRARGKGRLGKGCENVTFNYVDCLAAQS